MEKRLSRVFLDFVRDNTDAFSEEDSETAKQAVLELLEEGMPVRGLILRIMNHSFGDDILQCLIEKFKGTNEWENFLRAILSIHDIWLGNTALSNKTLGTILEDYQSPEFIMKKSGILQNKKHPLHDVIYKTAGNCYADAYWEKKVRWYISKQDCRRAWDELMKAFKGFILEPFEIGTYRPDSFYRNCHHGFMASAEILRTLTRELFEAMRGAGFFDNFKSGSFVNVQPRRFEGRIGKVGVAFAQAVLGDQRYPVTRPITPFNEDTCGMVITLAEHFKKIRDDGRRQKLERRLGKYEANHKQL